MVSQKLVLFIRSVLRNTQSRVRAYGDVLPELNTRGSVRLGRCAFPFLCNSAIGMVEKIVLSSCVVDTGSSRNLYDVGYAGYVVLLIEDPNRLQSSLNRLNTGVG